MCYNNFAMNNLTLTGLAPSIAEKISPMLREIIDQHARNIHSLHITGSAVMPDYNEKLSDINSVVVLHDMDLEFISFLAPLGRKYGKKRVAAPLVMTPEYISKSIDAFPVEFLDLKLLHKTVYGVDIFKDLAVESAPLRLQCEREVKVKLIGLRQGYLASAGEKDALAAVLRRSITGSIALFRSIIYLFGKEPPILRTEAVKMFCDTAGMKTTVFEKLLSLKAGAIKPSGQELHDLFRQYYSALESLENTLDDLHA